MKIIRTDNFNRDYVSDGLIAKNVNEFFAKLIVKLLNKYTGTDSQDYFKAVSDDHKLYVYDPR